MGTLEEPRAMLLPRDRDERQLSEAFLALICQHARSGELLGPDVGAILTAEFDRVVHGVDCVLELRHPDRTANHLAVSIEVPGLGEVPWDPFDQVRLELDRDELAPVKYFHSEWLDYKGWLHAPRVHFALSMLRLLMIVSDSEEGTFRFPGSQVHLNLLRAIAYQLVSFERFAAVRKREAAGEQLRRTLADVLGRLDALGMRTVLRDEDIDVEALKASKRLFEVFGDGLEDETEAGPTE